MQNSITIVSGLPRSGTSMIMQMLKAGGMELLTDEIRTPDEDNPRGYYEYEPVKKLNDNASCATLKNIPDSTSERQPASSTTSPVTTHCTSASALRLRPPQKQLQRPVIFSHFLSWLKRCRLL